MRIRKLLLLALSLVLAANLLSGCGRDNNDINVVTRESGSGTRGSFVELFKLEIRQENLKKDLITLDAITTNKTGVMLTTIAGDNKSIGYVSIGSLNNTVRALDIDGAAATVENIQNGSYKISRPFNIVTTGTASGLKKDFIDYIMSKEGQAVVSENNYVPVTNKGNIYTGYSSRPGGRLVIAGSSSVTPVMEKLKESYEAINPDVRIEIQMTDSSAGVRALLDGTCDIAMSSRDLTPEEAAQGNATIIAMDGIAVIVGKDNPKAGMTSAQVKQVFTGEVTDWDEIL